MLEPQIQPSPEQPLPAAHLFVYARPLMLARWVEEAFEVEMRQSPRSKAVRERSGNPRRSSPKV